MSVVRIFGTRNGVDSSAKVGPIIAIGIWLVRRPFRGGQACRRAYAEQHDGMNLVLRHLCHRTHVPKRGLKVRLGALVTSLALWTTAAINARISLSVSLAVPRRW